MPTDYLWIYRPNNSTINWKKLNKVLCPYGVYLCPCGKFSSRINSDYLIFRSNLESGIKLFSSWN